MSPRIVPPPIVPQVQALKEEALAYRLLLAAAVWKAGGSMAITEADIAHVARHASLLSDPIQGGQMLRVVDPDAAPHSGILLPGGGHA